MTVVMVMVVVVVVRDEVRVLGMGLQGELVTRPVTVMIHVREKVRVGPRKQVRLVKVRLVMVS